MDAKSPKATKQRLNLKLLITSVLALGILVGVVWLTPGFLIAYFVGIGSQGCLNTIVNTARSPDGLQKVVVFEHNCGATTSDLTYVSVLPVTSQLAEHTRPQDKLEPVVAVFIARHPSSRGSIYGSWQSIHKIAVTIDGSPEVCEAKTQIQAVAIQYFKRVRGHSVQIVPVAHCDAG